MAIPAFSPVFSRLSGRSAAVLLLDSSVSQLCERQKPKLRVKVEVSHCLIQNRRLLRQQCSGPVQVSKTRSERISMSTCVLGVRVSLVKLARQVVAG